MISFVCGTAEDRASRKEQHRARRIARKLHARYVSYCVPQILFHQEQVGVIQIAASVHAAWKHETEAKPDGHFVTMLVEPEIDELTELAEWATKIMSFVGVVHPDFFDLVFPRLSETLGYGYYHPQMMPGQAIYLCPIKMKPITLR